MFDTSLFVTLIAGAACALELVILMRDIYRTYVRAWEAEEAARKERVNNFVASLSEREARRFVKGW